MLDKNATELKRLMGRINNPGEPMSEEEEASYKGSHEFFEKAKLPVTVWDIQYETNDDDNPISGELEAVKVIEYGITPGSGATVPTIKCLHSDGSRFRCSVDHLYVDKNGAIGVIDATLAWVDVEEAKEAAGKLAVEMLPDIVKGLELLAKQREQELAASQQAPAAVASGSALDIKPLEQQAAAAIESGDPADATRFAQATGMQPTDFQAQLLAQGPAQLEQAVRAYQGQANPGLSDPAPAAPPLAAPEAVRKDKDDSPSPGM